MNEKRFSLYDAFTFGFRMAFDNVRLLLKVFAAVAAVFFASLGVAFIFNLKLLTNLRALVPEAKALIQCSGQQCTAAAQSLGKSLFILVFSAGWMIGLTILFLCLVCCMLMVGYIKIVLQVRDGKPASVSTLFEPWLLTPKFLLAGLIHLLITSFGLFLLVIPGLIWFVRFSFFSYFMVDKNAGIIGSLSSSYRMTRGYTIELIALFFLVMFITGLARVSVFGWIILFPVGSFAYAYLYRTLSSDQ